MLNMAARLSIDYNLVIFAKPARTRSDAAGPGMPGRATSSCYATAILLYHAAKQL